MYLFKSLADLENALWNWLGERIDEWEEENNAPFEEVALEVDITGLEGELIDSVAWEWIATLNIPPQRIVRLLEV